MPKNVIKIKHIDKVTVEVNDGNVLGTPLPCDGTESGWDNVGQMYYKAVPGVAPDVSPMLCYKVGSKWYCV